MKTTLWNILTAVLTLIWSTVRLSPYVLFGYYAIAMLYSDYQMTVNEAFVILFLFIFTSKTDTVKNES